MTYEYDIFLCLYSKNGVQTKVYILEIQIMFPFQYKPFTKVPYYNHVWLMEKEEGYTWDGEFTE